MRTLQYKSLNSAVGCNMVGVLLRSEPSFMGILNLMIEDKFLSFAVIIVLPFETGWPGVLVHPRPI